MVKGNEQPAQWHLSAVDVYRLWKRKWLTTSTQCNWAVYYHSCPTCLTGEDVPDFQTMLFHKSGSARSLSINKSDNCQCRQLFVTALLSWLTASCQSRRRESEFYILWLLSGEGRHLHMNQLSASLYPDNSVTASDTLRVVLCTFFLCGIQSLWRHIVVHPPLHHVIQKIWNIKVISFIM